MSVALPTIKVYVGFSQVANTGAWTLGTSDLGTGTVLGQPFVYTYTDIGADVRSWSLERGKQRHLDQYQAGRMNIKLDNSARYYDPLNLSGPYVTGGVTDVRPGKPAYVTLTHPVSAVEYTVFRGRVRDWVLDYTGGFDSVTTLILTDAMSELATTTVDLTTTAAYTGTNAAEVLVDAGITAFAVSTGASATQAMTFNGTALAALRTLEQTEQGALYVESNGDVIFSSRTDLISQSRSRTSQATFVGSGTLQYTDIGIAYESDQIHNKVTATREGGVAQTATNEDSVDLYGVKAFSLSGLANASDTAALELATFVSGRFGDPWVRIREIKMAPRTNGDLMTQALTRAIRDRVTVNFTPVGGGTAISQEVFIIGIKHEVTQDLRMTTTFAFDSTEWSVGWLLGTDALGSAVLGF